VRFEVLEARVQQLEAARPRDEEDAELRQALARSTKGRLFKASSLLQHTMVDSELKQAIEAACLSTVGEVGCWLRAAAGEREGVQIERVGRRWRATWCTYVAPETRVRR
jgi:hypothetical protein